MGAADAAVDAPAAADAAGVAATGAAGALEATGAADADAADADAAAEGACVEAPAELEAPEAEEEPADGASASEDSALPLVAGVAGVVDAVGVPGMVNSQPGWMRSASWMVVPSGWVVREAAPAM